MTGREMLGELLATWPGRLGVMLLAVLVILSIVALIRFPAGLGG